MSRLNLVEIRKSTHGGPGSQYSKYDGRLAVAINGSGDMLLLKEVYEQMGEPRYIKVKEDARERVLVLCPSADVCDRKVSAPQKSNGHQAKHPKLALKALLETRGYIIKGRSAVYRVDHTEDGMVINMKQSPELVV